MYILDQPLVATRNKPLI